MNELQEIIENRNEIISEKEINPAVIKVIDEVIKKNLDETTSNKIDNLNQEIMNLKDINTKLVFFYIKQNNENEYIKNDYESQINSLQSQIDVSKDNINKLKEMNEIITNREKEYQNTIQMLNEKLSKMDLMDSLLNKQNPVIDMETVENNSFRSSFRNSRMDEEKLQKLEELNKQVNELQDTNLKLEHEKQQADAKLEATIQNLKTVGELYNDLVKQHDEECNNLVYYYYYYRKYNIKNIMKKRLMIILIENKN